MISSLLALFLSGENLFSMFISTKTKQMLLRSHVRKNEISEEIENGNGTEIFFTFSREDDSIPDTVFDQFQEKTRLILSDPRTWKTRLLKDEITKVPIVFKERSNSPFMIISLVSDEFIKSEACPSIPGERNTQVPLSCTATFSRGPRRIYINATNWERGYYFALVNDGHKLKWNAETKSFPDFPGLSFQTLLNTYRGYVINHEVGHALGRMKHFIPQKNKPTRAPVMMQQTKHIYLYTPNAWPLDFE
jgi:hypothetical protein